MPLREAVTELARLAAMALVALAASAGLHVQVGLGFATSLLAGIAIFVVLAVLGAMLARRRRVTPADDAAVDPTAARLDEIAARLARLEHFAARAEEEAQHADADGVGNAPGLAVKVAQIDRLVADVGRVNARFEALRSQMQIEIKESQDRTAAELKVLETLVKQVAEHVAAGTGATPRFSVGRPPQPAPAAIRAEEPAPARESARPAARDDGPLLPDSDILEAVRRSVEANKIDLYLQPVVTLPQRRVRYYEALTRLRDVAGTLLLPGDYLSVAEAAGMMPLIDNVMLFRSVQVLRRLSERSSARGVFCNISFHSLLDPEFFPEFVAYLEQNTSLADSLHFEFSQRMLDTCGAIELESLQSLAGLGFRFALDQVRQLDIDFQALHDKGFRFVKIEGDILLNRMAEAGARIHGADMRAYLDRFGLELIVEKIEDERSLADLLDFDVKLGQGYLFSEPRPVRPEVFEATDASVAA